MQITLRGHLHAHQRTKERWVGIQQSCGKVPIRDEVLRTVKVLQNQVQQLGALYDALFDEPPLVRRNKEWDQVDLPGPICPERITINVVRDPVLANASFGATPASSQLVGADRPKRLHQVRPVLPRIHTVGRYLVVSGDIEKRSVI